MPDAIFDDPRLATLYDLFDDDRADLRLYLDLAKELQARNVLDVGAGTGTLACLLAERGFEVTALEPAAASQQVARRKPAGAKVRWLLGYVDDLPPMSVDLVTMTGNVAQVFLDDSDWLATLTALLARLRPGGHLVFETRRPERRAWLEWTPEKSAVRRFVPGTGPVRAWVQVAAVTCQLVTFRWNYRFETTGLELTSDSALRFREREDIERSLSCAGFALVEVRDAPDRPGREWIFLARRP